MKRILALSLCGVMLLSGLIGSTAEASESIDTIMDEVINKVIEKKENGDSTYYNLMIRYKDEIDKGTLELLYNTMLTPAQKSEIESRYGDVADQLNNLSNADIERLKSKIDDVAPSGGGGPGTPPNEDVPKDIEEEKPLAKVTFKDIGSTWPEAQDAINFMAGRGVLKGKTEGIFAPQDSITRAEFAKTIVVLLELNNDTAKANKIFNDVDKTQWYYEYVQIAFKHGIIEGTSNTTFAPNDLITRQEMAVMIARTMKIMGKTEILLPLQTKEMLNTYIDHGDVADWARENIALIVKNKIIQGKEDKNNKFLAPRDNATRAEAVVILKRFYDLLNN